MTNKQPEPTSTAPWNDPAVKYDTPLPEAAWVAWTPVALPVAVDVYNDEDPLAEPTQKTMLVPWNLTMRGSDPTDALDTLIGFSQIIANAGGKFVTDKTWREFDLSAPKPLPVDYAALVSQPIAASPLPVAQAAPQAAPVPLPPAVTGLPAATQMAHPGSDGYGEFHATQIVANASRDMTKTLFRLAGEQFSQFGVMCWENTLNEAGIATAQLQRGQRYDLGATWKCTYSLKEDGKPNVVVRLERVA